MDKTVSSTRNKDAKLIETDDQEAPKPRSGSGNLDGGRTPGEGGEDAFAPDINN